MSVTAKSTLKMRRLKTHKAPVRVITMNYLLSVLSEARMKHSLHLACDVDLLKRSRGWR